MLVFWGAVVHRDVGPIRPQATFAARRDAVDALLYAEIAERRAMDAAASARGAATSSRCSSRPSTRTARRWATPRSATSSRRSCSPATRRPRPRSRGRSTCCSATRHVLARLRARRRTTTPYLDAVVREVAADPAGRAGRRPHRDRAGADRRARDPRRHRPRRRDDHHPPPRGRLSRSRRASAPSASSAATRCRPTRWLPFGGGVRRCIGASFAQFEMATILRVLARSPLRLAVRRPEPMRATGVTIVPGRGVRVMPRARRSSPGATRRGRAPPARGRPRALPPRARCGVRAI